MGQETHRRSRSGRWTIPEVREGLVYTRGGSGRVGRPSGKSGMGWGTFVEVRDRSGDHQ